MTTCYDGAEHTGSATGGVGETIVWYTAPTGGSLTSAPSGTVSGTYTAYAASRNTLSNCESSLRTPVTVTVYGLPSAPAGGDVTTCYDGAEHTGSATGGVGETIVWYTAPTGGSLTSAPSGTVSGTYTAYAASRNTLSNCESSLRTPVTVTVYGLPSAPAAGDVTTCYDGAEHTGSATGGVGETIVWYTAPTGGSLTSAPSGTVSGTYTAYAASRNTLSNCESSLRTPVTVTVYGLPSAPAGGDVTTCYDGAEHTGSATGGVGETIVWYTAPTGGSLTSAPSGTVSGTYTAYAASRNTLSNCESSLRTPVTVTVYGLPSARVTIRPSGRRCDDLLRRSRAYRQCNGRRWRDDRVVHRPDRRQFDQCPFRNRFGNLYGVCGIQEYIQVTVRVRFGPQSREPLPFTGYHPPQRAAMLHPGPTLRNCEPSSYRQSDNGNGVGRLRSCGTIRPDSGRQM